MTKSKWGENRKIKNNDQAVRIYNAKRNFCKGFLMRKK